MTTLEQLRQTVPHYVIRNIIDNSFAIVYHGQVCNGGVWSEVKGERVFIEEDDLNASWRVEL